MEALLPFVASKLDQVSLVNNISYCKDWLYGQWQRVCFVIKSYDEAQASTLTNGIKRFKSELELAIHADKVLHQVIDAMVFESNLQAENSGLDLAQIGGTSAGNLSPMESVQSIAQKTLRECQRYQYLRKDLDTFYHHQEADMADVVDLIQVCSSHFHLYRVEAIRWEI